MPKANFVRSLQCECKPLSPYDISQRIRLQYSCVSTFQGDADLDPTMWRAYMVRYKEKPKRTPEDPEWYSCVVSLQQSKPWQDLSWTKEILQILDKPSHRTNNLVALKAMFNNRHAGGCLIAEAPGNVKADLNGFSLALGAAIPLGYRKILRAQKYLERHSAQDLEQMLNIPSELIPELISDDFEVGFEAALTMADDE